MNNAVFVIGIAGGSGSGKTSFLKELMSHYRPEQVALVSQDNYYKPKEMQVADQNGVINFDLPESIDRERFYNDMQVLADGKTLEFMEYNFNNPAWKPAPVIVQPAPVIIMEGLFVFHYEEIRNRLDCMVYIDVHQEERLNRRIRRDETERGYPEHEVRYQWDFHVRPAEQLYLEPYISQCNLVIDNTIHFSEGLSNLAGIIDRRLSLS